MEISPGFTLVGEDVATGTEPVELQPGSVIPVDQDLFEELGEPFEPGEHVGWLQGTLTVTRRDQLVCDFVFSFESGAEDSIVATGLLARVGDDSGAGVLAVTGGTGRFAGADGTVRVETRNPKRYIF